jgi:hypothetical protein
VLQASFQSTTFPGVTALPEQGMHAPPLTTPNDAASRRSRQNEGCEDE